MTSPREEKGAEEGGEDARLEPVAYSWEEVRAAVEREEDARLEHRLGEVTGTPERYETRGFRLLQRVQPYLEMLGGVAVGLHVAVMTLIINYLLFVWILHLNFDFF